MLQLYWTENYTVYFAIMLLCDFQVGTMQLSRLLRKWQRRVAS